VVEFLINTFLRENHSFFFILSIYVKTLEFVGTPRQAVVSCIGSGGQILYILDFHCRCRCGQLLTPLVLHHMKKLHTYSTGEKVVSRIRLDMEANKSILPC
jgi:hypothetical protein